MEYLVVLIAVVAAVYFFVYRPWKKNKDGAAPEIQPPPPQTELQPRERPPSRDENER